MEGIENGVRYFCRDGLLDLHLQAGDVEHLVTHLQGTIRRMTRADSVTVDGFQVIHNLSRICWEARSSSHITCLGKQELEFIYDELPNNGAFEFFTRIINITRNIVKNVECSPALANQTAKGLVAVMNS